MIDERVSQFFDMTQIERPSVIALYRGVPSEDIDGNCTTAPRAPNAPHADDNLGRVSRLPRHAAGGGEGNSIADSGQRH